MPESSRPPVEPGEILAGKYRVDRVLGVGGMGVVVAAHHIHLDDQVAIKFMLVEALSNPQAVARFAREAKAAVKVKGEHVVRVLDVGTLENGAPYMVMEYLKGKDLAQWLADKEPLPADLAVDFVLQAAEAVAEAHMHGIVHRDLKPANLFVYQRPDASYLIKVLDFGISKITGNSESTAMTHTSVVMGSPLYMAPEQLRSSKTADARSDLWSLGIILYELLSGEPPFLADTLPQLVHRTMAELPPPIAERRMDALPDGIEAVVLKCLEKMPENRYQNVAELADALAPFAPERSRVSIERISGLQHGTAAVLKTSAPPAVAAKKDGATVQTAASWTQTASRSPKTAIGIVGGVFVLGVIVAWLAMRPSPTTPTADSASATSTTAPPVAPAPATAEPAATDVTAIVQPSVVPTTQPELHPAEPVSGNRRDRRASGKVAARPTEAVAAPAPSAPSSPSSSAGPKKPSIGSLLDDRN